MPRNALATDVKYVATIEHVREVALVGSADLAYWSDRLAHEGLFAWSNAGRAEILISVPQLRWMGLTFRELSIAVRVSQRADGSTDDGVFLLYAFNSLRLLAFVERNWFSTPYYHAGISLDASRPCQFDVYDGDRAVIEARMGAAPRDVITREEAWFGRIYLPGLKAGATCGDKLFHAQITGETAISPFMASADDFAVRNSERHLPLNSLGASSFTPLEWHVRHDAVHARSATLKRPAVGGC